MKPIVIFFTASISNFDLSAQTGAVTSFQHTVRWVNESRFPTYYTNEIQKEVMDSTAEAIKKRFLIEDVEMPT